jgi:hypothetical protein
VGDTGDVAIDDGVATIDAPAVDPDGGAEVQVDADADVPSTVQDATIADDVPTLRSGSCDDLMNWDQTIADGSTVGKGSCAARSVDDIVAVIHSDYPELADIVPVVAADAGWLCGPDGCACAIESVCVPPTGVKVVSYRDGFRIVMERLLQNSQFKYHLKEYWYFETNEVCHPTLVGHYLVDLGVLSVTGSDLWGYPIRNHVEGRRCALDGGVDGAADAES